MDYPNVTHVIQYGPAEDRETYIHRLGRTGRANKHGNGILVFGGKGEERAVVGRELKGLNIKVRICEPRESSQEMLLTHRHINVSTIQRNKRYQDLILGEMVAKDSDGGGGINGHLNRKRINEKRLQKIHSVVGSNSDSTLKKYASNVYRSFLGYYTNRMKATGMMFKLDVVEYANTLALQMGFRPDNMPQVSLTMVRNMGLEGIRGLNVVNDVGSSEIRRQNDGGMKSDKHRKRFTSKRNR